MDSSPDRPLVSVLMTVYNREIFIAESIESVLASSYEHFELLLVDDGSTDRSLEIARSYASDTRIQIHENPRNLGDYGNRNRAAELARGKYLKYVDSDDMIYPHGLAVMVSSMEAFPEAGLGLCRPAEGKHPFPRQLSPREAYREEFLGNGLFGNAPLSAIIRAEAFRAVKGFSGKRHIGDTELWMNLSARFPVVKMVLGLTWWREHGEQEYSVRSKSALYPRLRFDSSLNALTSKECPLNEMERRLAIVRLKHRYARIIGGIFLRGNPRAAWQLYRLSGLSPRELLRGLKRLPSPPSLPPL
jgi:glycosyltransferase involved in cell wall biosynthesis